MSSLKKERKTAILYNRFLEMTKRKEKDPERETKEQGKTKRVKGKYHIILETVGVMILVGTIASFSTGTAQEVIASNSNIKKDNAISDVKENVVKVEKVEKKIEPVFGSTNAGDSSYKAILGKNGKNGINGLDGLDGSDGLDGLGGESGSDGINGIDGLNGVDGQSGKDGMNGQLGSDGINGKNGVNGIAGKSGLNGIAGKSGLNGKDGLNGKNGETGKDGADGAIGKDGLNGTDGKTAYAAAVEAGYTGTEAEYADFMASTPGKIIGFESELGMLNSNLAASVSAINESINKTIESITKTNVRVEECFTSVSSGKSLLASTLTGFSFPTDAAATFETIDTNVKKLADARYNNGFIDGQKNAMDNLQVTYVKHNHTGNATAGGGCYTNANIHNHTGSSSSGGGCYLTPQYRDDPIYGTCPTTWLSFLSYNHDAGYSRCYYICGRCRYEYMNNDSGDGIEKGISRPHQSRTPTSYNKVLIGYGLSCGKSDGQNLGYSEACGYTEGQIISATITY